MWESFSYENIHKVYPTLRLGAPIDVKTQLGTFILRYNAENAMVILEWGTGSPERGSANPALLTAKSMKLDGFLAMSQFSRMDRINRIIRPYRMIVEDGLILVEKEGLDGLRMASRKTWMHECAVFNEERRLKFDRINKLVKNLKVQNDKMVDYTLCAGCRVYSPSHVLDHANQGTIPSFMASSLAGYGEEAFKDAELIRETVKRHLILHFLWKYAEFYATPTERANVLYTLMRSTQWRGGTPPIVDGITQAPREPRNERTMISGSTSMGSAARRTFSNTLWSAGGPSRFEDPGRGPDVYMHGGVGATQLVNSFRAAWDHDPQAGDHQRDAGGLYEMQTSGNWVRINEVTQPLPPIVRQGSGFDLAFRTSFERTNRRRPTAGDAWTHDNGFTYILQEDGRWNPQPRTGAAEDTPQQLTPDRERALGPIRADSILDVQFRQRYLTDTGRAVRVGDRYLHNGVRYLWNENGDWIPIDEADESPPRRREPRPVQEVHRSSFLASQFRAWWAAQHNDRDPAPGSTYLHNGTVYTLSHSGSWFAGRPDNEDTQDRREPPARGPVQEFNELWFKVMNRAIENGEAMRFPDGIVRRWLAAGNTGAWYIVPETAIQENELIFEARGLDVGEIFAVRNGQGRVLAEYMYDNGMGRWFRSDIGDNANLRAQVIEARQNLMAERLERAIGSLGIPRDASPDDEIGVREAVEELTVVAERNLIAAEEEIRLQSEAEVGRPDEPSERETEEADPMNPEF